MAVSLPGYVLVLVLAFSKVSAFTLEDEMDLLRKLDVAAYASLYGMTLERVEAVTTDGWALELHRVRNMQVYDSKLSTPVFISHGCTCSSVDFMVNPRNESLIFILADRGYDVWAINYRANKFSNKVYKNGVLTEPTAEHYYRATWQYMAQYDVPAALDKILEVTHQEKLFVIGQSMGGSTLFAALSENKKYDDKILLYGALVPVIKFGQDTAVHLRASFKAAPLFPRLVRSRIFRSVFGQQIIDMNAPGVDGIKTLIKSAFCKNAPQVCNFLVEILETPLEGKPNPHMNMTRNDLYHIVYPAGVTAMNLYQFARQYLKPVWEKLDYDEVKQTRITNWQEYRKLKPPKYNFANITVPLQVYFVKKDKYFGVETARKLIEELDLESSEYLLVDDENMEHHDVVWGWDARCWVYDHLLTRMDDIESSRSRDRLNYRGRMKDFEKSLGFEDGCRASRPKERSE